MASGVALYFDDPGIALTTLEFDGSVSGSGCSRGYNEYDLTGGGERIRPWTVTGIAGYHTYAEFTAEPEENYEFKQWIYRLGDDFDSALSGTRQVSSENPFRYTGDQYIIIHAESVSSSSGGGGSGYTLTSYDYGVVESIVNRNDYVGYYDLFRIECSFTTSGTVRFYTTGGDGTADPFGMITTHNDWDKDYGVPEKPRELAEEFDTVTSFYIEYEVEANKTYYFWWGLDYEPGGGNINVYIVPPNLTGTTYVHNGTEWVKCIPFVVSKDGYWTIVSPYVNNGKQWIRCL